MTTLSLPSPSPFNPSRDGAFARTHPHLRAQLGSIHRQCKPLENSETETDVDDAINRVSPSFVHRVVGLLENEHEEELKALLQETYGMDNDRVSVDIDQVDFKSTTYHKSSPGRTKCPRNHAST